MAYSSILCTSINGHFGFAFLRLIVKSLKFVGLSETIDLLLVPSD
nr:MAG TPA: hypothetical protein [Caudoviricetes sp.]